MYVHLCWLTYLWRTGPCRDRQTDIGNGAPVQLTLVLDQVCLTPYRSICAYLSKHPFHNLLNKRMVWRLALRRPRCLSMREDLSMHMRRGVASSKGKGNLVTVLNKQQFQCVATVEEAKVPQFICDHNATEPGGPSPRQYLLGALASCTAMTVRTFIQNSAKTSPSTW